MARLFLALAVMGAQYAKDGSLVHPASLARLIWASISIGLNLVTQVASVRALRWSMLIDVAAAAFAVWSVPSTLVQALALLATSCQLLFRSGLSTYYVASLAAPLIVALIATGLSAGTVENSDSILLSILRQIVFAMAILNA